MTTCAASLLVVAGDVVPDDAFLPQVTHHRQAALLLYTVNLGN